MPDIFTPPAEESDTQAKETQLDSDVKPAPKEQVNQAIQPDSQSESGDSEDAENLSGSIKSQELQTVAKDTIAHPKDAMVGLPEKLRVEPSQIGLLSHYCPNPMGISFVNQERDEKIVLFLRRHFITNVPWIITAIVMMLLPIITYALFAISGLELFTIPPTLLFILLSFYYLVIGNYALTKFIEWFYHVGIVTKKRMLDLDVDNILQHHLSESNITDIVDVSYSQNGFFQSFFNYGDVPIQTEAIKANFEFEASPKPATVSDIVTDLRQMQADKRRSYD